MEIPSYFRRYLRALQPTIPNRDRAIQLHKTLVSRLKADEPFQDWYDGTFLYGSYIRNTTIQPIKDVDVCVLLSLDINDNKPEAVINRLRRVLERSGYEAKTALQRRSVRIDMSGTTLDVVPVVAVHGQDYFNIPDRTQSQWMRTHPKEHIATARRLNKDSGGRYVPFVKIVKAWHRYQQCDLRQIERPKPKGFTLEAMVAQYQDASAPSYAEAFVNFLSNLWDSCGYLLEMGKFPDVSNPGVAGEVLKLTIDAAEAKRFGEIVKSSLAAARDALALTGSESDSAKAWALIFGSKFPTEPASQNKAASFTRSADEVDDTEDEGIDDISEIDIPEAVKITTFSLRAKVSPRQDGPFQENYSSAGRPLAKGMWVEFSMIPPVISQPYDVWWIVENHGEEARRANDMGHVTSGGYSHKTREHTAYRGSHTMTCEIRRGGQVLARAKHTVNIR